jgi:hypothetical protein
MDLWFENYSRHQSVQMYRNEIAYIQNSPLGLICGTNRISEESLRRNLEKHFWNLIQYNQIILEDICIFEQMVQKTMKVWMENKEDSLYAISLRIFKNTMHNVQKQKEQSKKIQKTKAIYTMLRPLIEKGLQQNKKS